MKRQAITILFVLLAAGMLTQCRTKNDGLRFFAYPDTGEPVDCCAFRNPDDSVVLVLVNPSEKDRKQVQCRIHGKWHLIPLLPNSVSTTVFD